MKRTPFYLLLFLLIMTFFCCNHEKTEKEKILCRINGYKLYLDEFQIQLKDELELDDAFKLTQKAKQKFLEELIRKELLIQEATRLNLDGKEKFVRTIERYWKSTLIRDLMDLKCEEIIKRVSVSEEEITAHYNKMKNSEEDLPNLDMMHDRIKKDLTEEKKTQSLRDWIDDLRKKADIKIEQDLLLK